MIKKSILCAAIAIAVALAPASSAWAGSIFLTGHDPDFHASLGGNQTGAQNINIAAINFIMDPLFNPFSSLPFLFVESNIAPPSGHTIGENGIIASGYTTGTDYVAADASTLNAALDGLGSIYGGVVVASDFGGVLTSAELDILNARSTDIISFLNDGGGLYAMAESNSRAQLTTGSTLFGFLPFIVSSTQLNQVETGVTLTPFGASLGLLTTDVNGNASHNVFNGTFGLNVVDRDNQQNILTLAGRGQVTPGGIPEPATLLLLGTGLAAVGYRRRRTHR